MKTGTTSKIKYEWKASAATHSLKYIELTYLNSYTDFDLPLMKEIVALYLVHTPELLHSIKQNLRTGNWTDLFTAVHKLIPSLVLMGISKNDENIAKRIEHHARSKEFLDELPALVLLLEIIFNRVSIELAEELRNMKAT